MAGSIPKNGTVADPALVSIAPGNGVTIIDPVSVCLIRGASAPLRTIPLLCDSPIRIDDCTLPSPDVLVIPVPGLRVDWLADGTEHAQRGEVVSFDVVVPQATEEADCGGRTVEVREFVLLHGLPVARRRGVDRR